jgi:hypothetical protein
VDLFRWHALPQRLDGGGREVQALGKRARRGGLYQARWTESAMFFDLHLDGDFDLVVCTR